MSLNIQQIRNDFPILQQKINGRPLIYFDNAATSQKPKQVIDAVAEYYNSYNSNIHRGAHFLANKATEAYENSRSFIASYINAKYAHEINFVRGTTEAVNLVAHSYAKSFLKAGDEIIVSAIEHHSNIVPWQMACEATGATLKVIPVNDAGELEMDAFERMLSEHTKIVAVGYISNSLGTVNPVKMIVEKAHTVGAKVFIDAAQALPHQVVDVQSLDCDWLAFSGHKVYAPTGIGVLYGKENVMLQMSPYMGGGEMVDIVSFEKTTYNKLPYKFEAGTPHIEGGIVLGEALKYLEKVGLKNIGEYEHKLLQHLTEKLLQIDGLKIIGTAKNKVSLVSFVVDGVHAYDIGTLLDAQGVAVRTGHHCCQPAMKRFGVEGTCRASLAFYNTLEEIDSFAESLQKTISRLR